MQQCEKNLAVLLSVAALNNQSNAQKLSKSGADLGKKSVMGKEIRVPYNSVVGYFGYVGGDSKPDEEKGAKKYYYVYVWIPIAAHELGILMIFPVPENEKPSETDFQSPAYQNNSTDKSSYLDTWISFDRAIGVVSSADISKKGKSAT